MKCKYCGKDAQFFVGKNKSTPCCMDNISRCPAIRNKISEAKIGIAPPCAHLNKGKTSPRKGKTIYEIYGEEKAKILLKESSARSKGRPSSMSIEGRLSVSKSARKSINTRYESGWMPKAGRCKKVKYHSEIAGDVLLDGSWELDVAIFLDASGEKWVRNTERFEYINLSGGKSNYTPDFFLPNRNLYIEVKGYETDLDRCKWSQFPNKMIVWRKNEITAIRRKTALIDNLLE